MRSVNLAGDTPAGTVARTAPGALDQLRAATSHCHRRLEKRLAISQRLSSRSAYRAYLETLFGFHVPFETALGEHPVRRLLPDFDERRKVALLRSDLMALGALPESIAALPHCQYVPVLQNEAAAFGSLYVLEGATLGGQVLRRMVEQRLHLTSQSGASYLGSYGSNVGRMWQRFCSLVEDGCSDAGSRVIAASAAVSTFDSLEAWLCGRPA